MDAVLTMDPPSPASRCGTAARMPAQTPVRLTRSTRSHSDGSISCNLLKAAVPALL